ncbi:hypothetical protein HY029_01510 [Candidatus Gottesmanbacteria bacterium]|nr:hypothetical protein [Candidatus Gottesmanbacteria bacterium]
MRVFKYLRFGSQKGEIATLLTIVSLAVMLSGVVAGTFAAQKARTKTQSKAANSVSYCKNGDWECDTDTGWHQCANAEEQAKWRDPNDQNLMNQWAQVISDQGRGSCIPFISHVSEDDTLNKTLENSGLNDNQSPKLEPQNPVNSVTVDNIYFIEPPTVNNTTHGIVNLNNPNNVAIDKISAYSSPSINLSPLIPIDIYDTNGKGYNITWTPTESGQHWILIEIHAAGAPYYSFTQIEMVADENTSGPKENPLPTPSYYFSLNIFDPINGKYPNGEATLNNEYSFQIFADNPVGSLPPNLDYTVNIDRVSKNGVPLNFAENLGMTLNPLPLKDSSGNKTYLFSWIPRETGNYTVTFRGMDNSTLQDAFFYAIVNVTDANSSSGSLFQLVEKLDCNPNRPESDGCNTITGGETFRSEIKPEFKMPDGFTFDLKLENSVDGAQVQKNGNGESWTFTFTPINYSHNYTFNFTGTSPTGDESKLSSYIIVKPNTSGSVNKISQSNCKDIMKQYIENQATPVDVSSCLNRMINQLSPMSIHKCDVKKGCK